MVIYGYAVTQGVQYFDIDDPIYGKSHLTVADFTSHYQGSGSWTHSYITKSYIPIMIFKRYPIEDLLHRRIWEARTLLDVKAGRDPESAKDAGSLSLGLAHEVFSIGLESLAKGESFPERTGLRVMEFDGSKCRSVFDVAAGGADGEVRQMSGQSPYLDLFPKALEVATAESGRERESDLRLLRVPALNFEALWLHDDDHSGDLLVPLRGFHGFKAMERVPYADALARLQKAAKNQQAQEETMGA
jgi:hypothetical protein